ncbi:hypothetical protein ACFWY9_10260 [Amycolatopsis sp. NPDC059027]|uniref:hypothetical protein n=1 Tax=Amycolatopsis sp. NPDC059027 TaxID=3346709 RepID=UPI00366C1390
MSHALAAAFGQELRDRGMDGARPGGDGLVGVSGAGRRIAGSLLSKKIDVTWTTEESGLLLGISLKTINFRDGNSGNYQKNLTNRRGDLAVEAMTLHGRFPYAVLAGLLILDKGATTDNTAKRNSTFTNAFPKVRSLTDRGKPSGQEEQFERCYIMVVDANPFQPSLECYHAKDPVNAVPLEAVFDDLVALVLERNFEFYEPSGSGELRETGTKES